MKPAGAAFLPAAAVDDPCIDPELCEYANTCPQVQDPDTNTSCGNIYPCGQLPNGGGNCGITNANGHYPSLFELEDVKITAASQTCRVFGMNCSISCNSSVSNARYPYIGCRKEQTPIVIDVLGNGVRLSGIDAAVAFDLNANGLLERIAWTAADSDDSLLALDRDGDSRITSGAELFGSVTPQAASNNLNGYRALAALDANGDGLIDARDPLYSSLRLWRDTDHDAESAPGELSALASRGIRSLSVDYRTTSRRDRHGNLLRYRAKVEGARGQSFSYDVIFAAVRNPANAAASRKLAE